MCAQHAYEKTMKNYTFLLAFNTTQTPAQYWKTKTHSKAVIGGPALVTSAPRIDHTLIAQKQRAHMRTQIHTHIHIKHTQ